MVQLCYLCRKVDYLNPQLTYHRFPADRKRLMSWLKSVDIDKSTKLPTGAVICSKHFNATDFIIGPTGKTFLLKEAVPLVQCRIPSKVKNIRQSCSRLTDTRREDWLRAIGRNVNEDLSSECSICSEHFSPDDFQTRGHKRMLKPTAVPKVKLRPRDFRQQQLLPRTSQDVPLVKPETIICSERIDETSYFENGPNGRVFVKSASASAVPGCFEEVYLASYSPSAVSPEAKDLVEDRNSSTSDTLTASEAESNNYGEIETRINPQQHPGTNHFEDHNYYRQPPEDLDTQDVEMKQQEIDIKPSVEILASQHHHIEKFPSVENSEIAIKMEPEDENRGWSATEWDLESGTQNDNNHSFAEANNDVILTPTILVDRHQTFIKLKKPPSQIRYVGDIKLEDFSTPSRAKHCLSLLKKEIDRQRTKIKYLQLRNKRLEAKVNKLTTMPQTRSQSIIGKKKRIKVGDKLPDVDLFEDLPTSKVNLAELAKGKKLIVFAVPGAFTPGCSKTHLPGYVAKAGELKKQGVNEIICIAVNDPFVMAAWAKDQKTAGKVRLLADPSAAFTRALDLTVDIAPLGGVRSKRYSMVVDNGVITSLQVEPDGTGLSCSLADKIKL